MPEEPQAPVETPKDGEKADHVEKDDRSDSKKRPAKHVLSYKVFAVLIILTVVINAAGLAFNSANREKADISEHDLGTYHFLADLSEKGPVAAADFDLHIAVLDEIKSEAQQRLAAKKFRVQQDVEELLRKAHGGDFDDPSLGELKRRIKARINETLGMRAIDDVIITGLKLKRAVAKAEPPAEAGRPLPWVESSLAAPKP